MTANNNNNNNNNNNKNNYSKILYALNVKKIYSNVDRMDGCKSSIELILLLLKERMATIFLKSKHTTAERITQTIDDSNITCENKYSIIQRIRGWMTATLPVIETNTPLQS